MPKEKVLITVKTYPSISEKYDELVCTAGIKEDGSWIRIYPIPFRKKNYNEQYSKYQWIEVDLVKNEKDFRKESFRPVNDNTKIKIVGKIKPDGDDWQERRRIILTNVRKDISTLISEAKDKEIGTSLAVFKPSEIHKLEIKEEKREWSKKKLEKLKQLNLFESYKGRNFKLVRKLPYKFSYKFMDSKNSQHTMKIEDWEIGQLFWNLLKKHRGDEKLACEGVRKKYIDDFAKTKDLYLFLGTTMKYHNIAPNPFIIIGTFHPKPTTQTYLF